MKEPQNTVRPTMKQYKLAVFVAEFINEHGYGPSYREIMRGLNYGSVATVAEHIQNLIARGHLKKRDKSARSLEVISMPEPEIEVTKEVKEHEEKWLVEKVEIYFKEQETAPRIEPGKLDELYVLVGALKVLGMDEAAYMYIRRLNELKTKNEARKTQG